MKHGYQFSQWKRLILIAFAATLTLAHGVDAKNFVSFNGQFYLSYPDTWEQIEDRKSVV